MIHLVLGKQGSGKTLFLIKKAYEAYKSGKKVYSNVALTFPYDPIDYNDIINYKYSDAVVIIDEIHILLPARRSTSEINMNICLGFLSMARKKKLEIYGSTQNARKVDVLFREEVDYFYKCTKWGYIRTWQIMNSNEDLGDTPIVIMLDVLETYEGHTLKDFFLANPYYNAYDSTQIIEVKGINEIKGVRRHGVKT